MRPGFDTIGFLRSKWSFLLAIGCGALLRTYQIHREIVADDEIHSVFNTLHAYRSIASRFGVADYCIPLTLFFKLVASTFGLNEMWLRAPTLIFGVMALVVLPLIIQPHVGHRVRSTFAWLLAISPLLIYFSRYARPYGIVVVLGFAGAVAFWNWWRGGSRGWIGAYVSCAALAPYFHLSALPVSLAPLLFAMADRIVHRRAGFERSLGELARVAAWVGSGLAVLLAWPLTRDFPALAGKVGQSRLSSELVAATAGLLFGTGKGLLVLALLGIAFLGVVLTARRALGLVLYLGWIVICQVAVAVGLPAVDAPIVLARYLLPCLPILLLLTAVGLVGLDALLQRRIRRAPGGLVPALVCGIAIFLGPLRNTHAHRSNWTNHEVFQHDYGPPESFSDARWGRVQVPRFYEELRRRPAGSMVIVEAPWWPYASRSSFPYYQGVHRQWVVLGFMARSEMEAAKLGELRIDAHGFRFRNFVLLHDQSALRERGVSFVVLHKRGDAELSGVEPRGVGRVVEWWIRWYAERYGEPIYADDWIVVFDLKQG